jgi:MFS family permease
MITSGIWRIGGTMTWPFFALYVLHLGGNYYHIGLIAAVSSFLGLIPSFFGGRLADIYGRKRIVVSVQFFIALNKILFVLAPGWEWLFLARSIDSILQGIREPGFNALFADYTSMETRAMSYGMWHSIPPIFGLLPPFIAGVLMDRIGIIPAQRLAYTVLLFSCFISALIRVKYLNETYVAESRGKEKLSIISDTLTDFKETAKILPRNLWTLISMGVLFNFAASMVMNYWVTYATEDVIHLTATQWGLVHTTATIIIILASMPAALLVEKYGRLKIVLLSLILTPITVLGFIYSNNFYQVLLIYNIGMIFSSMGSVSGQAMFTDYSPSEHRGRINALTRIIGATRTFGFQMVGMGITGAFGGIIGGIVYGGISYTLPFQIMAVIAVITAVIGYTLLKEK